MDKDLILDFCEFTEKLLLYQFICEKHVEMDQTDDALSLIKNLTDHSGFRPKMRAIRRICIALAKKGDMETLIDVLRSNELWREEFNTATVDILKFLIEQGNRMNVLLFLESPLEFPKLEALLKAILPEPARK